MGTDSGFVVDPAPWDMGSPTDAGTDSGFVVDPPPADFDASAAAEQLRDQGAVRLAEAEDDDAYLPSGALKRRLRLVDQWRDSAPRDAIRTVDLPLSSPPQPELRGERDGDRVRVTVLGVRESFGTRWEAEGTIDGDGAVVEWVPASAEDQIAVAVRTRGGIAVVTLRASAV